jgi:hypothetical protein
MRQGSTSPAPGTSSQTGGVSPPLEVAPASIEVSSATATIKFAQRVVTGRLRVATATFSDGGRRLSFSIEGVAYAGDAAASGSPGGLIRRVTVSGTGSGATVLVDLLRRGTGHRFTVEHDTVGIRVS